MTPYKIPEINIWVDLDTIQFIEEPKEDTFPKFPFMSTCVMRWQHAFRNDINFYTWEQEGSCNTGKFISFTNENGIPTKVAEVYEKVFTPFLEAWKKKDEPIS